MEYSNIITVIAFRNLDKTGVEPYNKNRRALLRRLAQSINHKHSLCWPLGYQPSGQHAFVVSMYNAHTRQSRNRRNAITRLFHISLTPFLKGVANRLYVTVPFRPFGLSIIQYCPASCQILPPDDGRLFIWLSPALSRRWSPGIPPASASQRPPGSPDGTCPTGGGSRLLPSHIRS